MAYSVKITGFPISADEARFEIEPPWWTADEIMKTVSLAKAVVDGYIELSADLTPMQARDLHARLRPAASRGVYAYAPWQKVIRPALERMDAVFSAPAGRFSSFRIQVTEWESGLIE